MNKHSGKWLYKNITMGACFVFFTFCLYAQEEVKKVDGVNRSAALIYLQKAVNYCENEEWDMALKHAELGHSYDENIADLFYIQALAITHLGLPRADALKFAEEACREGLIWRVFDESQASLLVAKLCVETLEYQKALSFLANVSFPTVDSDYYTAFALYGLGRDEAARALIRTGLDQWTFDARFPKLFFMHEKKIVTSARTQKLAKDILDRLYVWEESDPSLMIYAAPFEKDLSETIRRLKVYRNMYMQKEAKKDRYITSHAILLSLKYGIIDEETAITEFFKVYTTMKNPYVDKKEGEALYTSHLIELCKLVGNYDLRKNISEKMKYFEGVLLEDENGTGFVSSKVFFKQGRPFVAEFDLNQDGYYDYRVECNFGTPAKISGKNKNHYLIYDQYPAVKSAQLEDKHYILRPLALNWAPVKQVSLDLRVNTRGNPEDEFFTLMLNGFTSFPNERDILFSTLYGEQKDSHIEGGIQKIHFAKGQPLFSETTVNGIVYSHMNYKNGYPVENRIDSNGDGYFETVELYSSKGKLKKISIDLNKNNFFEYTEEYKTNGTVHKAWDSNEDGTKELIHIEYPNGDARTEWIHPKTYKRLVVTFEKGIPTSLHDGRKAIPIIQDANKEIYWVGESPLFSKKVTEKLLEKFNLETLGVVSYLVKINEFSRNGVVSEDAIDPIRREGVIFAVRSGGYIFAEFIMNVMESGENSDD